MASLDPALICTSMRDRFDIRSDGMFILFFIGKKAHFSSKVSGNLSDRSGQELQYRLLIRGKTDGRSVDS